jgi:acyl carrier protein
VIPVLFRGDQVNIKQEVKDAFHVIAPHVKYDDIDMSNQFYEQGKFDSLDVYNFITLLHKQTGVDIDESQLSQLQNLNELIEYINAHTP